MSLQAAKLLLQVEWASRDRYARIIKGLRAKIRANPGARLALPDAPADKITAEGQTTFLPKRVCEGAQPRYGMCDRCGIENASKASIHDPRCLSFVSAKPISVPALHAPADGEPYKSALFEVIARLGPAVADAAIIGETFGIPEILGVVDEAVKQLKARASGPALTADEWALIGTRRHAEASWCACDPAKSKRLREAAEDADAQARKLRGPHAEARKP